ncbi:queuosine precursor transporter [Flavobacteriales bacterium]|nr:queuosine precursor transporter [Flavobacteriales bacterium]
MKTQAQSLFLILSGLFIAALVCCNLIFQKFFSWTPFGIYTFEISAGIIPYPITFLVTDIISEVYGKKKANKVVISGLVASVFVLGIVMIANSAPATEWSPVDNATFSDVFGLTGIAVGASMLAYLLAQFVDIRIFHFWKKLTQGKHLWLRNNASTFSSQLVDTATVLLLLCSAGAIEWDKFGVLLLNGFIFKIIMAVIDTPILYLVIGMIRKKFKLEIGEEIEI